MKRVPLFVLLSLLVPVVAIAQVPPRPPTPPSAPMPAPAPLPPPAPWAMVPPVPPVPMIDMLAIEDAVRAAEAQVASTARWPSVDTQAIREAARHAAEQAREEVRAAMDLERESLRAATWPAMHMNFAIADMQDRAFAMAGRMQSDSSSYNGGLSLMSERRYEEAIVRFDKVIAAKSAHADGGMYHKAYCLAKLGKSDEAVATLAELRKTYAQSPYLKDARALEADVRKLGPSQVDDEDLKILAIQSMQGQDPDQTIPLLEGVLNKSTNALKVKERALFVLATMDQPRAHQILLSYAKGGGNPDLQRKAISYLGTRGQKTSSAELIEIYNSTSDLDVRLAVISAFRSAGDKTSLMGIASGVGIGSGQGGGVAVAPMASSGTSVYALRSRAMSGLSDLASPQELWPLYQKEENADLRSQWVSVFASMNAVDQLLQIVKTEKEPSVRQKAIRSLGNLKADKTGSALVEMYGSGDKDIRTAVISALGNQDNADSLIAIARKETDPELKREIVSRLADMAKRSKTAMSYLMELIK